MKKKKKLGIFTLAMINVAAVLSLRNFPALAEYGFSLIFYLTLSALFFFIPSALVSAELAAAWPRKGGVFLWVKEAFGPRWGFVAIFMQWVENLPWYPAVFAFAASAIAYVFNPELANNKFFVITVIWIAIWAATFANFRSMRFSAFLSSSGAICGTILPGLLIIVLGAIHVASGMSSPITFSLQSLIPNMGNLNQLMLLAGMLMAVAGMEMSAVHVTEIENPKKNFPRAIFASSALIIFLSVLGALSIAVVVPSQELSLSAGVPQAFHALFVAHGIDFLTAPVAILLTYGAFAMAVTWMVGPSKGVLEVAKEGYLPAYIRKENKHGMPIGALVVQGIVASVLSLSVLFMPTVSSAFWIMSALAAQLYLVMYLFMFAAAIKLRYSKADVKRPYKIPGGKIGIWIVAGSAFLASLFVIGFGFIPAEAVREKGPLAMALYSGFLLIGVCIFVSIPILLHSRGEKKR